MSWTCITVSQCVTLIMQCCPGPHFCKLLTVGRRSYYFDAMVLEVLVATATPAYNETDLINWFIGGLVTNLR